VTAWGSHEELCSEKIIVTNEKRIVIQKINEYDKNIEFEEMAHMNECTQKMKQERTPPKKNSEFCRLIHIG
jgi:hypothetical protein